jgi:hypothetical protein
MSHKERSDQQAKRPDPKEQVEERAQPLTMSSGRAYKPAPPDP